jgi:hypothetical protein
MCNGVFVAVVTSFAAHWRVAKTHRLVDLGAIDFMAAAWFDRNSFSEAPVTTLVGVLAGGCASGHSPSGK